MAGGMFEKELEEELMKFTATGTEQSDGAHKKNVDMETDGSSVKEHAGKPPREAQIRGKSTGAPTNVKNEVLKAKKDMETDGSSVEEHAGKPPREAQIRGKSTGAPKNVKNEVLKAKKDTSTSKKGASSAREREDEVMKSSTKSSNLVEQTKEVPENTGDDVDIIGGAKIPGYRLIEAEPIATTESSSSFGATDNSGDELSDVFGDSEASSSLRGDGEPSQVVFNRFSELSRMSTKRRKVSSQWKSHIQPLTWRLKWVELQMKMLSLFAQGYDRKLEDCNKLKQIRFEKSESEGGCARQISFSHVKDANHVLRRKKRKRAESSGDLAKYMSQHNLFSYYTNRRKHGPPSQLTASKFINDDESWASNELLMKFQNSDSSSDDALQKIFSLESKIIAMKSKVKKILHDNSWIFLDGPGQNNGTPSSIGTYIAAQLMSEYSLNDSLAPEDEATVHENMVPCIRNKAHHNGDGDIICRRGVNEQGNTSEEVQVRSTQIQRPLVIRDGSVNPNSSSTQMDDDSNVDDQPPKKIRSVATLTGPRSKRTGGNRSSKRGGK